ncbi:MAG: POTRA domain-containing protein, partial [Thermodesulfobacteriota bacterium]
MTNKKNRMRLLTIMAVITTILLPANLLAAPQNGPGVVFLPLRINTLDQAGPLTAKADRLLAEAAKGHKMSFIKRGAVNTILKRASWPPPLAAIIPFLPENFTGNVAVGSLTRFGVQISLDLTVYDLKDQAATGVFFEEISSEDELAAAFEKVIGKISAFGQRQQLISEIKVEGNRRIDTGAIRRKISSLPGKDFNANILRDDLKSVFGMGYFEDISISSEETPSGHIVIFTVKEKPVIGSVKISGNDKLEESTIREVIKIRASSIISDREVRESIANISNLYREEGYFDTNVEAEQEDTGRGRVDLKFVIREGKKIYIKEINFYGNRSFSASKIRKSITTSKKGWFSFMTDSGLLNREKLAHDASRITAFYHNNGFVEARVGEPEIVQKNDWLYVYFNIDEGARYKCGSIQVSGDLVVDREVLLDLIKVDQEEFFNRMTLRQDVLRITDYYAEKGFAFSEVSPKSTKNPATRTVDLNFQ